MTHFEALVGQLGADRFLKEVYGREAKLLPHDATWSRGIFDLAALNRILNHTPLVYPRVRATDHENSVHKYDLIRDQDRYANNRNDDLDAEKLTRAIAKGATLVIDRVHRLSGPLEDFIDGLANELGMRVSCNAYYSAHKTLGVNAHFDRHDVFAVQVHGAKRWFYREAPHDLSRPIRAQTSPPVSPGREGWNSVVLRAGDVFYCPRGVWHFTQTEGSSSAHLAVGLYPATLRDWLDQLCKGEDMPQLLERYVQGPAATHDNAHSLLDELLSRLRASSLRALPRADVAPRPYIDLE